MIQPPAEYGPPRWRTACLVCSEPITPGRDEPVCSDRCWVEVRHCLRIDELPDGMTRNEQIRCLAKRGCDYAWIGAWYGLAEGTVKNLVYGRQASTKRRRNVRKGRGRLDQTAPPGKTPVLPSTVGPPRKHVRCAVCAGPVETADDAPGPVQPICSETCRAVLSRRLEIDSLPGTLARNEQIGTLVEAGKAVRDIAAWYNLSPTRIRMIAREEAPDAAITNDRGSASTSRGRGWLGR